MKRILIGLVNLIACVMMLSGCGVAVLTATSIKQEPPFMSAEMNGTVTDATRCVGRYWQREINKNFNVFWNVYTYSYEVQVEGYHGSGGPVISLVIDFNEVNGKTIATVYVHHALPQNDPRRTITIKAINACSAR